jgi:hypothetical protein
MHLLSLFKLLSQTRALSQPIWEKIEESIFMDINALIRKPNYLGSLMLEMCKYDVSD